MDDGRASTRQGAWLSGASLLAASSTLICCAIPALLVTIGAGAALSSLISIFPQLVWLSEYKLELFVLAGLTLFAAFVAQQRARRAPCPVDATLRDLCLRTRKVSSWVFAVSCVVYLTGAWFAIIWPWLLE